ncbi:MAG: DUF1684 domain-containing protein [Candidatus Aminicenantes bacterium]|nr:MAG: DUF1684 domain-containing protein [Candidatus Aminicenantes bacterium]
MKKCFGLLIVMTIFALAAGCKTGSQPGEVDTGDTGYAAKIKAWQQKRLQGLKEKDGWLSLAGLFWLKEGKNTFGSDKDNDLVIEEVKAPAHMGTFFWEKEEVRFVASEEGTVLHDDKEVSELKLENDMKGKPTVLRCGSLSWYIIKRGNRLGVRLKDSQHPRLSKLEKIDSFQVDPRWRVEAVLECFKEPRKVNVPNVLGTESEEEIQGVLVFKIGGKEYRLLPLGSKGPLFVIFGDETNGKETYGGGRFLSVAEPDQQGHTVIDFNMAVNPPCVFSAHATCPLPPLENLLKLRVTAGEKMLEGLGHH